MIITGFADEAAPDVAGQIAAHKELGWKTMEIRAVDGVNAAMLDDAAWEKTASALEKAGMGIVCFGSSIANWSRPISGGFQIDIDELARAIPRMKRFKCKLIRVMSWVQAKPPLSDKEWRDEAIRRMKVLAKMAEDGGVILAHENCSGWASEGPAQTLEMLEKVNSPAFKLVWDTGNPVAHGQEVWPYYLAARDHAVHVHIKDAKKNEKGQSQFCYPGDGLGRVAEAVADIMARGYDGAFSIEPHIASIIHLGEYADKKQTAKDVYIEYGRRIEKIVAGARKKIKK
jgi:sugar phosphate isomerase/epimerase